MAQPTNKQKNNNQSINQLMRIKLITITQTECCRWSSLFTSWSWRSRRRQWSKI